ncbi:MAG: hypothetical protein ACHP7O_02755 [Burkholderiales bacterium]
MDWIISRIPKMGFVAALLTFGIALAATDINTGPASSFSMTTGIVPVLNLRLSAGKRARNSGDFATAIAECKQGIVELGRAYFYPGLADDSNKLESAELKQNEGEMLTSANLYCRALESRIESYRFKLQNPAIETNAQRDSLGQNDPVTLSSGAAETSKNTDANEFNMRLEERRVARQAAEVAAARENATAATADTLNRINAAKDLLSGKPSNGPSGVFEVTKVGSRYGEFQFIGWHRDSGNLHEYYSVDAGDGGNVRLALVKKVIEVIRKHKSGSFEFQSWRLGHVVLMSARPEDNDALEQFLMKELFEDERAYLQKVTR